MPHPLPGQPLDEHTRIERLRAEHVLKLAETYRADETLDFSMKCGLLVILGNSAGVVLTDSFAQMVLKTPTLTADTFHEKLASAQAAEKRVAFFKKCSSSLLNATAKYKDVAILALQMYVYPMLIPHIASNYLLYYIHQVSPTASLLTKAILSPALLHLNPRLILSGYHFMFIDKVIGLLESVDPILYWYLLYEHHWNRAFSDVTPLVNFYHQALAPCKNEALSCEPWISELPPCKNAALSICGLWISFAMAIGVLAWNRRSYFRQTAELFYVRMVEEEEKVNEEEEVFVDAFQYSIEELMAELRLDQPDAELRLDQPDDLIDDDVFVDALEEQPAPIVWALDQNPSRPMLDGKTPVSTPTVKLVW